MLESHKSLIYIDFLAKKKTMPSTIKTPTTVRDAMSRSACILSMIAVQFLTVDGIIDSLPRHLIIPYYAMVNFASILSIAKFRKSEVTACVMDLAIYELLVYIAVYCGYIFSRNVYYSDIKIFAFKALSLIFILVLLRLVWPTRAEWPPIGIFSTLARTPNPNVKNIAFASLTIAGAVLASNTVVPHFPVFWAQVCIGVSLLYIVGRYWNVISGMVSNTVTENNETKTDNKLLRDILVRETEKLKAIIAERVALSDAVDGSPESFLSGCSDEEKEVIAYLAELNPAIREELIAYIATLAKSRDQ